MKVFTLKSLLKTWNLETPPIKEIVTQKISKHIYLDKSLLSKNRSLEYLPTQER